MREDGYDAVKGGAILLVVFGHVWLGLGGAGLIPDPVLMARVEAAIYLFHMPVFFFVSGLFFRVRGDWRSFLRGRAWLLLWPLLLWSWIEGGALYVSGQGAGLGPLDVLTYPIPVKSVFWFLWTLFVLQVLAYLVSRVFGQGAALALAGLAIGSVLFFLLGLDPGSVATVIENAPYFLAGVLIRPLRSQLIRGGVLPFVGALMLLLLAEGVHLRDGQGARWFQITAFLAVLGFVGILGRVGGTGPGRTLAWLGARTMPIYLMHIILTAGTRVVLLSVGIEGLWPHVLAGMVMGVGVPLIADDIAQRLGLAGLAGFGQRVRSG